MATSSFWTGPAGRWLASTKNIAGGALAVVALVLHVVVGLGPLWPLVVAAAYAVGALVAPLERVLQALSDIVARWDELAAAPDQAHTVEQIIGDYLPTSLQRYLDLPRHLRAGAPHAELLDQLGILERESLRIREAVYSRTVQALGDQGRFLREKFGRSELDL